MEPLNLLKSMSVPNLSQTAGYHSKNANESLEILKAPKKSGKKIKIEYPVNNKKQVIFLGHSCVWLPEHENKSGMYEHLKSSNSFSIDKTIEKKNEPILNVGKDEINQLVSKKNDFAQQIYQNNKPGIDAKNAIKKNEEIPIKSEEKYIKSSNGTRIRMKSRISVEQNKNDLQKNNQSTGNNTKLNESYVVSQHSNELKKLSNKEKQKIRSQNNEKELVFVGHSATWMPKELTKPEITISIPENKKNIFFLGHSCTWLPENSEIPKDFFEKFGVEKPKVDVIEVKEKQNVLFDGKIDLRNNEYKKNSNSSILNTSKNNRDSNARIHANEIVNHLNNREKNLKILKQDQSEVQYLRKDDKKQHDIKSFKTKSSNRIIDVESSNGTRVIAHTKIDKNNDSQKPSVQNKKNNPIFIGHSCTWLPNDALEKQEFKQPNNLRAPLNHNNFSSKKNQDSIKFMGHPVKYDVNTWNVLPKCSENEQKNNNLNRNENINRKSVEGNVKIIAKEKFVKSEFKNISNKAKPITIAEKNNFKQTNEKARQVINNTKVLPNNNLQSGIKNAPQVLAISKSNNSVADQPYEGRSIQFIGHTCIWIDDADKNYNKLETSLNSPKLKKLVKETNMDALTANKSDKKPHQTIKDSSATKEKLFKNEKDIKSIAVTSTLIDSNQLKISENDFEFNTWLKNKVMKKDNKNFQNKSYKITESTVVLDKSTNSIKIIAKDEINSNIQSTSTKIPIKEKLDTKNLQYNVILDPKSNKLKFTMNIKPDEAKLDKQKSSEGKEKDDFKNFEKKSFAENEKQSNTDIGSKDSNKFTSGQQSLPTTFEIALGKLNNISEKKENLDAKLQIEDTKYVFKSNDHNSKIDVNPTKLVTKRKTLSHSLEATHKPKKDEINNANELDSKTDLNKKLPNLNKDKKMSTENCEKRDGSKIEKKIPIKNILNDKKSENDKVNTHTKEVSLNSLKAEKSGNPYIVDKKVDPVINVKSDKLKIVPEKISSHNNKENQMDKNLTLKPEELKSKFQKSAESSKTSDSTKGKLVNGTTKASLNITDKTSSKESSSIKENEPTKTVKFFQSEHIKEETKPKFNESLKKQAANNIAAKDKINVIADNSVIQDSQNLKENKGFILIEPNKNTQNIKPTKNNSFILPDKVLSKRSELKQSEIENSDYLERSISDHMKAEKTIQEAKTDVAEKTDTQIKKKKISEPLNQIEKQTSVKNNNQFSEKSTAKLKDEEKSEAEISHYKKQVQREQSEMNKIIKKMELIKPNDRFKSPTKIINENQTNAKILDKLNGQKVSGNIQKQQVTQTKVDEFSTKDIPNVKKEKSEAIENHPSDMVNNNHTTVDIIHKDKQKDKIQQSAYAISSIVRNKLNETALNLRVLNSTAKLKNDSPEKIFDFSKELGKNDLNKSKSFTIKVNNVNKVQNSKELNKPTVAKALHETNIPKKTYSNPLERVYKELDIKLKAAEDSILKIEKTRLHTPNKSQPSTIKCILTKNQLQDIYLARMEYDKHSVKVFPENLAHTKVPIDKEKIQKKATFETVSVNLKKKILEESLKSPNKLRNVYIPFSFEISRSVRDRTNLQTAITPKAKVSNPILNKYKNYFQGSDDKPSIKKDKLSIFHEIKNMIKEDLFTHPAAASTVTTIENQITSKTQIISKNVDKQDNSEKIHAKVSIKQKKSENDELQLSEESCASQPYVDGKMRPLTIFQEIKNMIKEDVLSIPIQNSTKLENNVKNLSTEIIKKQIKENPIKANTKISSNTVQIKNIPETKSSNSKFTKELEIKNNVSDNLVVLQKIDPLSKVDAAKIAFESEKLEKDEVKVKITNHFKKTTIPLSNDSKQTKAISDKSEKKHSIEKIPDEMKLYSTENKENIKPLESKISTKVNRTEINENLDKVTLKNVTELHKTDQLTRQRPETLMEQIQYLFKVNKAPKTDEQTKSETDELLELLQIKKDSHQNTKHIKPKSIKENNIKIEREKLLEPLKDDAFRTLKSNESVILSTAQKNCTNLAESPNQKLLDKNSIEFERAKLFNTTIREEQPKISTQSRRGNLDLNKVKEFKVTDTPASPIIDRINRSISSNQENLEAKKQIYNTEKISENDMNNLYGKEIINPKSKHIKSDNAKILNQSESLPISRKTSENELGVRDKNTIDKNAMDKNSKDKNAAVLKKIYDKKNDLNIKGNNENKQFIQNESQTSINPPISILNHLTNLNTEQSKIDQNIKLFTETGKNVENKQITNAKEKSLRKNDTDQMNIETNKKSLSTSNELTESNKAKPNLINSSDGNKKSQERILNSNDSVKNNKNNVDNDENKKSSIVNFTKNTEKLNKNNSFDYDVESNAIDLERNHYDSFEVNPFTKNQILVKILCSLKLATIKKD